MADNKTEASILRSIGATVHKNSGRGKYMKADGHDDTFVIDVKEAAKSFTLNTKVWDKICSDAYQVDPNKDPMLLVVLGGRKRLAIIDHYVLQALVDELTSTKAILEEVRLNATQRWYD
jgi:hypothetical protein